MAILASLDIVLGAQSRDLNRALFKARRDIRKFSRQAGQTFGGIARGARNSLGVAAAGFALLAKRTLESTDAQIKMSRSLGLSFSRMQELHFAFGQLGIESGKFNKLLLRTSQLYYELERGTSTYRESLGAIGISLKDLQGLNTEQMLKRIAQAAKAAGIETAKTQGALATAFGARLAGLLGSYIESAEAAEQWAERLREVGGVIRDQAGVEIENLNDTVTLLTKTLNAQFTNALIASTGAVGNFDPMIKRAGTAVFDATTAFLGFGKAVYEARNALVFLAKAFITYKILALFAGIVASAQAAANAFKSLAQALKLARLASGAFATIATGGLALGTWIALEAAIAGVSNAIGSIGTVANTAAGEVSDLHTELVKVGNSTSLIDRISKGLAGLLGHKFPEPETGATPARAVGSAPGEGRRLVITPMSKPSAEVVKEATEMAKTFGDVMRVELPPIFAEGFGGAVKDGDASGVWHGDRRADWRHNVICAGG